MHALLVRDLQTRSSIVEVNQRTAVQQELLTKIALRNKRHVACRVVLQVSVRYVEKKKRCNNMQTHQMQGKSGKVAEAVPFQRQLQFYIPFFFFFSLFLFAVVDQVHHACVMQQQSKSTLHTYHTSMSILPKTWGCNFNSSLLLRVRLFFFQGVVNLLTCPPPYSLR